MLRKFCQPKTSLAIANVRWFFDGTPQWFNMPNAQDQFPPL
jgi:hypothetical protein